MSIYAITYYLKEESHSCGCEDHDHDHHHHGRDDYEITSHIKTLGTWAHFMPTSFLVRTELSSNEILAKLKDCVESNDLIFVTKVDKDDVASLTPGVVEWINK
ncbi:hypothetical protein [Clostridium cylindrosporum]|uniref:Uncharacterized protein n=1 Tax=Clostridium cylindrosporum DSM 605 TaxID=1121307 RepID=A0A0J8DCJ2_CLOCY|nr:hypothetical protein [Clostridium cylindrosporum]KMT21978.1 hypothetical protein CLCY_3c02490 [Clostridium cylindrosporum DSM 605]